MLDESKIIPSEEENNETPQTSEIQEEKTPINLTTDGISSKNEVVEENEKEELPKVEESILVTKNSDKNEEPMVLSKVETSFF